MGIEIINHNSDGQYYVKFLAKDYSTDTWMSEADIMKEYNHGPKALKKYKDRLIPLHERNFTIKSKNDTTKTCTVSYRNNGGKVTSVPIEDLKKSPFWESAIGKFKPRIQDRTGRKDTSTSRAGRKQKDTRTWSEKQHKKNEEDQIQFDLEKTHWPFDHLDKPLITPQLKHDRLKMFKDATGNEALAQRVCCVCDEPTLLTRGTTMPISKVPNKHVLSTSGDLDVGISSPTLKMHLRDRDEQGHVFICAGCFSCLDNETPKPPKNSIFLNDIGGDVPEVLKDLTLPERLMISPIICKAYVLKLVSYGSPQSAQRGIKGNSIAFMQDVDEVSTQLPCIDNTVKYLKVCFIGDESCPLPTQQIKKILTVRRERVKLALEWLCENHVGFKNLGIQIDKRQLAQLPENDIPDSITTHITRSGDVDSALGESSSYVPQNNAELPDTNPDETIPIHRSGVLDVDNTTVSEDELLQGATNNLDPSLIKVKSGSTPISSYNNPDFWTLAYPCLFPYGIGGCNDTYQKLHIWLKHLLNHRDDRFRKDYSFMFVGYSISNVRAVCRQTKFSICRPGNDDNVLSVSSKDLEKAFESIKKSKSSNPHITDPTVRQLLDQIRSVGKNLPGSDFQRRSLQHEIRALMVKLGLPSFFITINPADYHHPLVLHFAGKKVNLDAPFEGDWITKEERARLVADDPVAAAKFFHYLVETWLECILGVNSQLKMNEVGVLGRTTGYYGTVETQGRGSLHLHILVWIHGSKNPEEFIRDLTRDDGEGRKFRDKMMDYLSSVVYEQFPHGHAPQPGSLPVEKPDTHVCCERPAEYPTDDRTHHIPVSASSKEECESDDDLIQTSPLRVNVPQHDNKFNRDLVRLVNECNVHHHTATCYKYGHKNCRFEFERPAVDLDIKDGVIFLERKKGNGWVNNYNDVMTAALRCNTDIKFICNGKGSKALSFYITDYITKKALSTHNAFPLIIAADKEIENGIHPCGKNPLFTPAQQANRDLIVKCLNKLTTHSERSGPEVATLLLGKPLHYTSHKFTKVFITFFVKLFDRHQPDNTQEGDTEHFSLSPNIDKSTYNLTNQRVDYTLRDPDSSVGLYDFAAQYYKTKLSPSKKPPQNSIRFCDQHPQHETHFMAHLQNPHSWHVPVIVGQQFPAKSVDSELYYKLFLILFKPFVDAEKDLKTESTWELSYETWMEELAGTQPDKHKSLLIYESNINAISSGRDRQKKENEARAKLREEQGLIEEDERHASRRSYDPYESIFAPPADSGLAADITPDVELPKPKEKTGLGAFARSAVLSLLAHGGLRPHTSSSHSSSSDSLSYLCTNLQTCHSLLTNPDTKKALQKSINEQREKARLPAGTTPESENEQQGRKKRSESPYSQFDVDTLETISKEFTLNKEQKSAFMKVGHTFLSELDPDVTTPQLLGYIGGPGGTGKSQVIKAIQKLFFHCGASASLKSCAYTGTAASNINGSTLSSLIKEKTHSKKKKDDHLTVSLSSVGSLRQNFHGVKFIIIDEVSMISTFMLSKLDARLKQAASPSVPFGGMHILFFGDFVQYPPVAGKALFKPILPRPSPAQPNDSDSDSNDPDDSGKPTRSKKDKTEDISHHPAGRNLWLLLNFAVFLKQQMRQTDEGYGKILTDLRNNDNKRISMHFQLLQSRVVGSKYADKDATFDNFHDAPLITTRNAVRTAVNFAKTKARAISLKEKQVVLVARDTWKPNPHLDNLRMKTEILHQTDNKCADLIGMLSCVSGMPLVVKSNLATELGVCNGTRCTLSRIVFPPDQHPFETSSENGELHIVQPSRQPIMVIVKIPNPKFETFVGLAPGEFPIFPITKKFDYHYYSDGKKTSASIERTQFPVLPGFALTGYTAQGGTFPRAVLDLTVPSGRGCGPVNHADTYVLLSRMKTRKGVLILRRFDEKVLLGHRDPDLEAELTRLRTLERRSSTSQTPSPRVRGSPKKAKTGPVSSGTSKRPRSSRQVKF